MRKDRIWVKQSCKYRPRKQDPKPLMQGGCVMGSPFSFVGPVWPFLQVNPIIQVALFTQELGREWPGGGGRGLPMIQGKNNLLFKIRRLI